MKGIDLAKWNAVTSYKQIKEDGCEFAILKIVNKSGKIEDSFEKHLKGCEDAHIPVTGVYNYSYATNAAKAETDANKVVSILAAHKMPKVTVVWLDVEDDCQKKIGRKLIEIINTYAAVIEKAGYKCGIYTGQSFYNSYIKPYVNSLSISRKLFWIARYYKGYDSMNLKDKVNESYKPLEDIAGWQYTSSGVIKGIKGKVDFNLMYKTVEKKNPYREPALTVRSGSEGESVLWVQWELNNSGIGYNIPLNGTYDDMTKGAVIDFQKRQNLEPDGVVGNNTKTALKKYIS